MEWIIDDIADVLAVTDVKKLLHQYFREGKGKDPIVHFYETFLSEYDPKTREKRGVYYTPEPVVSYIVRSLHHILKDRFGRSDGIASDSVTVLDPAAGTLTFLAEAAKLAVAEFVSKYGEGGKEKFIKEHILENFYAFELMMAPYAVGHLKMSFLLEELGHSLKQDDRFKLYLTNTVEMEELEQTELPGMASLSEESYLAGRVKKEEPILVILGNPPYSGHSANQGKWIDDLLKKGYIHENGVRDNGYYQLDGKPLGEKNPKWLQDDYVKFIRFAQWKIDQTGEGVLGFITNHSYLDNPTFRGMRQSLMNSFNDIYLLDLHGNSLKKERCPDGSKDENVFDIRQGTAIALFVKEKGKKSKNNRKVHHAELWGLRKKKYDWLLKNDITTTKWKRLSPKSEFYFFIPRDERLIELYEKSLKVTDIFPENSVGIVTARDKFVIDTDRKALERRIRMFCDKKVPDELIQEPFNLKDKSNWKLKLARERVRNDKDWENSITRILYRPFDIKWIFYHDDLIERSRKKVMRHMMQENLGLVTSRQTQSHFKHVFVTNKIIEFNLTGTAGRYGSGYLFPLYLYPALNKKNLFSHIEEAKGKQPNISKKLSSALSEAYRKEQTPEEIFYYIYAVLYSNSYRTKYSEFLRVDFPRVPFTKEHKLFEEMGKCGKRLVDLHLLQSSELDPPVARFQGKGNNKVEKVKYNEKEARTYVNQDQYFEGVAKEIWEYRIGGYQVCNKWLKDRKGGILSLEDIKRYCKVATAIQRTIKVQRNIDVIYSEVEKGIIEF
ncbi:MAG: type ISP restriction/modification enzyme [Desulfobacteria bacterium]